MEKLGVTRFNEDTWKENKMWRTSRNYSGCIYNTPTRISKNVLPNCILFVLEMNNSTNKIEGIGLIKNHLNLQKKYKIYKDNNYNRFTYKSKYRIERKDLTESENQIINILDTILFTGSRHMKRGQGIQTIAEWINKNKIFDFTDFIKKIFINKFTDIETNIF